MNETGTISLKRRDLQFAKEYGWTDQQSFKDTDGESLKNLHAGNQADIPVCNCRRCIRWKHRRKIEKKQNELGRELNRLEIQSANNDVWYETNLARQRDGLT